MKAKNLNASSVKTRRLIRDTFAELLYEKKNISKITVTELVQRADINRSTFYSHYDDVRHVAEDIKAETLKAFFENKTITNVNDIEPFFDEIYTYIKKNDSFFRLIFISDEVTNFVRHLGNICKGRIYQRHSIIIQKQEPAVSVHALLDLRSSPFSQNRPEAFADLITHREPPCTRIRLGFLNYIAHITHPLKLMIDVQNLVFQINIFDGQAAKL